MRDGPRHTFSGFYVVAILAAFCFAPLARAQSTAATGSLPAQPISRDCGSTAELQGCPITNSVHYHRFIDAVFGWETLIGPPISSLMSQTLTSHAGYSSDGDGYAYHYAVNLVNNVEGKFFARYAAPVIFHQDDAYHTVGPGHPAHVRIVHILAHIFVTRSADDSHGVFNMSGIPSAVATALVNNPQKPREQRTVGKNLEAVGWNVGIFAAGDAWTEYKGALTRLVPGHKRGSSSATP